MSGSLPRLLIATALVVAPSNLAHSYVGSALVAGAIASTSAGRAVWIAGGVSALVFVLSLAAGRLRPRA